MEVHHHPNVEKKRFKEYVLEFIMIFLAVTMGFIAENVRESITEHRNEKELMETLIKDLKEDKKLIEKQIEDSRLGIVYSDSLIQMVASGDLMKNTADLYWYGRMVNRWTAFYNSSRTIDEMKNGGLFHIVKNNDVTNAIIAYYAFIPQIRNFEDRFLVIGHEYRKMFVQIFDAQVVNQMIDRVGMQPQRLTGHPPLMMEDKKTLNELSGWVNALISSRLLIIQFEKTMLDHGENLIMMIKKEYNLEDEGL